MIIYLIIAATLTCLIESPIVYLYLHKQAKKDLILNIILINLITNLILNVTNMLISSVIFVLIAEAVIPVIEAYMYRYCYPSINIKKLLFICYLDITFLAQLFL